MRRYGAVNDVISIFKHEFTYERDQTCYESEQNCYERAQLTAHAPSDAQAAEELVFVMRLSHKTYERFCVQRPPLTTIAPFADPNAWAYPNTCGPG